MHEQLIAKSPEGAKAACAATLGVFDWLERYKTAVVAGVQQTMRTEDDAPIEDGEAARPELLQISSCQRRWTRRMQAIFSELAT